MLNEYSFPGRLLKDDPVYWEDITPTCDYCGSDDIYFADYGVKVCHSCFDDNCEGVGNYISRMVRNDLKDF